MKTLQTIKLMIPAVLTLVLASCGGGGSNINPDSKMSEVAGEMMGLKTFIIEYKTTMNAPQMKSTSIMTQWIDNENDRHVIHTESENEYMGKKEKQHSLMIMKDGWSYIIDLTNKSGFKSKDMDLDEDPTEMFMSEDDVTFRQMIEGEGGKIMGNEKFLGKDCIVVEMNEQDETGEAGLTTMWYYKGIPLKITNAFYTMEAIKFEENASIPDDKFEVPADIKIAEMPGF
jgi:hypothetical protein